MMEIYITVVSNTKEAGEAIVKQGHTGQLFRWDGFLTLFGRAML